MTEMILFLLVVVLLIGAAIQTLRAKSLLLSALWLAGVSVMTATLLYMLFAHQVAVIELSVGAGLVTILFIFAIGVAGDEEVERSAIVPRVIPAVLVLGSVTLLVVLGRSSGWLRPLPIKNSLASNFSQVRSLDLLVQVVLIFAGVLGLVGILAEAKAPLDHPMADEIAAKREQDLLSMEQQSSQTLGDADQAEPARINPGGSSTRSSRSG
jgi:NADH:ubiquinone oxidoreductase subunit 6 (subunit J)